MVVDDRPRYDDDRRRAQHCVASVRCASDERRRQGSHLLRTLFNRRHFRRSLSFVEPTRQSQYDAGAAAVGVAVATRHSRADRRRCVLFEMSLTDRQRLIGDDRRLIAARDTMRRHSTALRSFSKALPKLIDAQLRCRFVFFSLVVPVNVHYVCF